jgi:hypothetical protein
VERGFGGDGLSVRRVVRVPIGFELGRRQVADLAVEADFVVPVDPLDDRDP